MDFRERLREEIAFSGLSYKELSAKTGISKRAIVSYVSEQACMPSADVAVKLAKVLHTSVEYLISGEQIKISTENTSGELRNLLCFYKSMSKQQQKLLLSIAENINNCLN